MSVIGTCKPESPDFESTVANQSTAHGKKPFMTVPSAEDIQNEVDGFFDMDVFGEIMGQPLGLGYDMCDICDQGAAGIAGAISKSPWPGGASMWVNIVNTLLKALAGGDGYSAIDWSLVDSSLGGLDSDLSSIRTMLDSYEGG